MGNQTPQGEQTKEETPDEITFDWTEGPKVGDKAEAEMWLNFTKDKIDEYEAEHSRHIGVPRGNSGQGVDSK